MVAEENWKWHFNTTIKETLLWLRWWRRWSWGRDEAVAVALFLVVSLTPSFLAKLLLLSLMARCLTITMSTQAVTAITRHISATYSPSSSSSSSAAGHLYVRTYWSSCAYRPSSMYKNIGCHAAAAAQEVVFNSRIFCPRVGLCCDTVNWWQCLAEPPILWPPLKSHLAKSSPRKPPPCWSWSWNDKDFMIGKGTEKSFAAIKLDNNCPRIWHLIGNTKPFPLLHSFAMACNYFRNLIH